jgi:hypothetical protein
MHQTYGIAVAITLFFGSLAFVAVEIENWNRSRTDDAWGATLTLTWQLMIILPLLSAFVVGCARKLAQHLRRI